MKMQKYWKSGMTGYVWRIFRDSQYLNKGILTVMIKKIAASLVVVIFFFTFLAKNVKINAIIFIMNQTDFE